MATNDKKLNLKAAAIITAFASASATWAGLTANTSFIVPILGPLLTDTPGLTAITIGMISALASLLELKLSQAIFTATGSVALGFIFGNAAVKAFAGLIPGWGTAFNATTTFIITQGIGWGVFWIFRDHKEAIDSGNFSIKQLRTSLRKSIQSAINKSKEGKLDQVVVPENVKPQYNELIKKLSDAKTNDEREEILQKINSLLKPYSIGE